MTFVQLVFEVEFMQAIILEVLPLNMLFSNLSPSALYPIVAFPDQPKSPQRYVKMAYDWNPFVITNPWKVLSYPEIIYINKIEDTLYIYDILG